MKYYSVVVSGNMIHVHKIEKYATDKEIIELAQFDFPCHSSC